MGELLLCSEPIAAMPFYIENASLNVYSIEELCYYIKTNTYMLEQSFMNEELCTWIERQIKMPYLSKRLRQLMRDNCSLYEFVFEIIKSSGYFSIQEIQDIIFTIRQFEEKSDFECKKMRVDKMLEEGKYLHCIFEYRQLLESNDVNKADKKLIGNLWHNLGTSYVRLFLFKEAAGCYNKAFTFNDNYESLKECIMSYKCAHEDEIVNKIIEDNKLSDVQVIEIINELSKTDLSINEEDINDDILQWKEEYRRHAFF